MEVPQTVKRPLSHAEAEEPLQVKRITEHATLPTRGSLFAAGYDLSR
jgi:hypothetical protein